MKRLFFVVLALVVSAGFVLASGGAEAAGSTGGAQLNPPGTYPITKQPTSFTAVTIYGTNESSGKPGDSKFSAYLEKLTNVKVIYKDVIDSSIATEKINLMLASGDLPDAILTPWNINVQQAFIYGSQGTFLALNDLIKERMPGLAGQYQKFPNYAKQLTAPDGKMYAFPYLEAGCFHCTMSMKFWVYQPWLTKLGLKAPTTTEEMYSMLKAFKTKDPNGNGLADEIPLNGSSGGWNGLPITFLMNAFTYTNTGNYMKNEGGKVTFVPVSNEWREGLKYINRLYKEGLIAPEIFVQKLDQCTAQVENPSVPLVGSFAAGWYGVFTVNGGGTGRFADFQPISPVAGPTGLRQASFNQQAANPHTFITKVAKDPKVIASWVDWYYQEPVQVKIDLSWDFSEEGKGWRYLTADEKKLGMVSRDGLPAETMPLGYVKQYGKDKYDDGITRSSPRWGWRDFGGMPIEWAKDPSKQEWRLMVATRDIMAPFKAEKSMPPNLVFPAAVQQEFADLQTALTGATGAVMQWTTEFILGTKNVNDDAEWQKYLAEMKRAGYERYEKIWSDVVKGAGY